MQGDFRAAVVSMPWVSLRRPSIQLGLLAAAGQRAGFGVEPRHLNIDFAREVGPDVYDVLSEHRGRMFGEWIFSLEAFPDDAPDRGDAFLDRFGGELEPHLLRVSATLDRIREIRHTDVPRYLDRLVATERWADLQLVGFSSTFQQNAASVALARRLKDAFPHLLIVFGGANCEAEMGLELLRTVACIDLVVVGEGDLTFPELLTAVRDGRDALEVPGVAGRLAGAVRTARPRPPLANLDTLPIPDYADFFERGRRLGILSDGGRHEVDLPFESARGCWWGQKHQCTFCGLNGSSIAFRAKSAARVAAELATLARTYRSFRFEAVDNIVDMRYLHTLFAELAADGVDYEMFYEVKANLTRAQLRTLKRGGVTRIQPGIESLNSHVLRLMRKGVSAIQNVNTLRWSRYYDVSVGWNLLWGFPGETVEDYARQAQLFPKLVHLQPPSGAGRIWMERFSPIFTDPDSFPVRYLKPESSYALVYPATVDLSRLAYFFEYEFRDSLPDDAYTATRRAAEAWQATWEGSAKPTCTYWSTAELVHVEDLRSPDAPASFTFEGPLAALYLACSERPRHAAAAAAALGGHWPVGEVESALGEFCRFGLMMRDEDQFLSLALPAVTGR